MNCGLLTLRSKVSKIIMLPKLQLLLWQIVVSGEGVHFRVVIEVIMNSFISIIFEL